MTVGTDSGEIREDARVLVLRLADGAVVLDAVVVGGGPSVYGGCTLCHPATRP